MGARLAAAILAAAVLLPVHAAAQSGDEVLLVRVEGVVTRGTLLHIEEGLSEASERRVPLVIELDTPGGLVDATLDIHKAIVRADVPVMTFVGPRGAFAASAGTFILLMGQPSGMAPSTQIGSAQPIEVAPTGESRNASSKVENFLVERMREIAERTGRNETLAVRFVTENLNMGEQEALAAGLVDVVADDVRDFVRAVHGMQAVVGSGTVTLDTDDARVVELGPGALTRLVEIIGNPQISFILFLVGLYALIFGLASPGTFVPETIGALMLVLALIGLGLFDANTAGILLLLLAGVFFVAEVFTPTHGVLSVAGVITLVLAAVFLINEPLLPVDFLRRFILVGLVSGLISGGFVMWAVAFALRARTLPPAGQLVGMEAEVVEALDPVGMVQLRGELWKARVEHGEAGVGSTVRVMERRSLELVVVPVGDTQAESADVGDESDDGT